MRPAVSGVVADATPGRATNACPKIVSMEKLKTYPEHETRLNGYAHRTEKPPYVPEGRRLMQSYFVRDLDYSEARNATPGDRSPDNPFWLCRSCHEPGRLAGIDWCTRCARHRMNRRYKLMYRFRKNLPHDNFADAYPNLRALAMEYEPCPCCRFVLAHRYGVAPQNATTGP